MDPAAIEDLNDPNWQPPKRGIITAAAILGVVSSLLWLWPALLGLLALGSARVGGLFIAVFFVITVLAAFGFIASAITLRGKLPWLIVTIVIQGLFMALGLLALGAEAMLTLRFLGALATVIVGIIAVPQARALRKSGLDF